MSADSLSPAPTHLVRIPLVFAGIIDEVLDALGAVPLRRLGRDFHWVRFADPRVLRDSPAAMLVRWSLPVGHSWPCAPRRTEGFIEKAAQAIARKFGEAGVQTLVCGPLDPSAADRYHHRLASNLRGRTLQLMDPRLAAIRHAEEQDPLQPSLYALVGEEGLICGVQCPREAGGFHAGGVKFIRQSGPDQVSRAGAKIAEALHQLRLYREAPTAGGEWLELGASPGGMTAELLDRGYRVTAIDRAPLDARLHGRVGLRVVQDDVARYRAEAPVDAVLCDMNGDPLAAMRQVARLAGHLRDGGLVIFTLKLPDAGSLREILACADGARAIAAEADLRCLATRHLGHNRREFTMMFERAAATTA